MPLSRARTRPLACVWDEVREGIKMRLEGHRCMPGSFHDNMGSLSSHETIACRNSGTSIDCVYLTAHFSSRKESNAGDVSMPAAGADGNIRSDIRSEEPSSNARPKGHGRGREKLLRPREMNEHGHKQKQIWSIICSAVQHPFPADLCSPGV